MTRRTRSSQQRTAGSSWTFSRIASIRRMIADADDKSADAWSPAVRDMFDYCKWFAFQIFYDKGEKIRRWQLIDRNFFRSIGTAICVGPSAKVFTSRPAKRQARRGRREAILAALTEKYSAALRAGLRLLPGKLRQSARERSARAQMMGVKMKNENLQKTP